MRNIILIVFIFLIVNNCKAQDGGYKDSKFDWNDNGKVTPIVMNSQFANEDAVILFDSLLIEEIHDVIESSAASNRIERCMRIRFNNQDGVNKYSSTILPESLDPTWDYSETPIIKREERHRPIADLNSIIYIAARMIKGDGSTVPVKIKDERLRESYKINMNTHNYYSFKYTLENIKPGDEVEIRYYAKNCSIGNRVFLHGTLAKQKVKYTFKYDHSAELYIVNQKNGLQFQDSSDNKKYTQFTWEMENLPGCLMEKGARPYTELPYFTYYYHHQDFGVMNEKNLTLTKILPYTWPAVLRNFITFVDIPTDDYSKKNFEPSYKRLNNLIAEITDTLKDTSAFARFDRFHLYVVDEFKYKNDSNRIQGENQENENLNKYIANKTLREMSRKRFYIRSLESCKVPYMRTFIHDIRTEELDFSTYTPMVSSTNIFLTLYKGQKFYYLPKLHMFGWYVNEVPFYYENTNVILIPQDEPTDYSYMHAPPVKFIQTTMPNSTQKDNFRNTSVLADVNLASDVIQFDTRLDLSGQFSTMTRGYYIYNYFDSSINLRYIHKLNDINSTTFLDTIECTKRSVEFPFPFSFRMKYHGSGMVKHVANDEISISLTNWFYHITEENIKSQNRSLSYFPDFTNTDTYKYYLKFEKDVTILNAVDLECNISTDWGNYSFTVSQPQPNIILIVSTFIVLKDKIPANQVEKLDQMYSSILNLDKSPLKIKAK